MNERMIASADYSCGWSGMLGERNAFDNNRNVYTNNLGKQYPLYSSLTQMLKQHLMCTIMFINHSIKVESTKPCYF